MNGGVVVEQAGAILFGSWASYRLILRRVPIPAQAGRPSALAACILQFSRLIARRTSLLDGGARFFFLFLLVHKFVSMLRNDAYY